MDLINRKEVMEDLSLAFAFHAYAGAVAESIVKAQPAVDAMPVVRCKDCKYFELNHTEHVDGIPLILAHQICTRWGNGCKTDENGFCFMGEKVTE